MTKTEHLLTILAEECAEVSQRATKALRFSLQEVQVVQTLTNAERIIQEYADLCAAVEMPCADGALNIGDDFAAMVDGKKERVRLYLDYSNLCGTLSQQGGK